MSGDVFTGLLDKVIKSLRGNLISHILVEEGGSITHTYPLNTEKKIHFFSNGCIVLGLLHLLNTDFETHGRLQRVRTVCTCIPKIFRSRRGILGPKFIN